MNMTKRILVPIDGSPLSSKALEVALSDYPDADVTVLHVMDPIGSGFNIVEVMRPKFRDGAPPGSVSIEYWNEWYESARAKATKLFDKAQEIADEFDVTLRTETEFGEPKHVVVEYAEEHDTDRIVLGSHGRAGATRLVLGSVAETVTRRASMPVLVVK
ncbi:universal stress protein UspA [Haladaptatus sp. T7]|nr:universal stress protein UspA [Haladaptatus sp. T7]